MCRWLRGSRGSRRHCQKSAEAVVAARDRGEGPNDDTESRTTDLGIDRDDRSAVNSGGPAEVSEPAARELVRGVEVGTATGGRTKSEDCATMERVVERANMQLAYQRVVRNKDAAGVDDLALTELRGWLAVHWPSVRKALLEGRYLPRPVRRVDIPKPQGGVRTLGIPTVVDLDLEKFFDRVNHDVLMARVARRVGDERVLKLIRRFLAAGRMHDGLVEARTRGTPQGGPLSPLLSNILLTDLDRELERRGLAFCRDADDCNVYVRSRVAGERVMRGLRAFLEGGLAPAGQRGEKCGGAAVGANVPRLPRDRAATDAAQDRSRQRAPVAADRAH